MSRAKAITLVTEGQNHFVSVSFTDKDRPEHFMDIEVKVEHGGVMLRCPRYDGQIFFPVEALPMIVEAINEQAAHHADAA